MAQGYLQVDVVSDANSFPVQDADIVVARTEEPDEIIEETRTNSSGQTENLPLDAPPLELSLSPEETERPYAEYTIRITAPGFEPFVVSGTEVLADVTAIQGIRLAFFFELSHITQTSILIFSSVFKIPQYLDFVKRVHKKSKRKKCFLYCGSVPSKAGAHQSVKVRLW